jgi:hypothetical protein
MLFIRGLDFVTMTPIRDADQRKYGFINPKDNIDNLTRETP